MRAMPRRSKFSPAAQARFCEALAALCVVGKACEAAGVSRQTAYDHRAKNPEFAKAWDDALEAGIDELEGEAFRRAVVGVDVPLVHKGQFTYLRDLTAINPKSGKPFPPDQAPLLLDAAGQPCVATVKGYSDQLLIFLLRAHRPEKYRETRRVELSPFAKLSDAELDAELAQVEESLQAGRARIVAIMGVAAERKASDDGSDLA
ncbi:MAG: hypothetical protein K9J82_01150 [Methylotenera sp.]|nr:hypothetical protein [Methylotenera sp.]